MIEMRARATKAMAEVPGSCIEERQVRLSIPIEAVASRPAKPFMRVWLASVPERTDDTIDAMCEAAAKVFFDAFGSYFVDEVQYGWEDGVRNGYGRYPKKE
jgi:hypothetical protein